MKTLLKAVFYLFVVTITFFVVLFAVGLGVIIVMEPSTNILIDVIASMMSAVAVSMAIFGTYLLLKENESDAMVQ